VPRVTENNTQSDGLTVKYPGVVRLGKLFGVLTTALIAALGFYKFFIQEEHRPQLVIDLDAEVISLEESRELVRVVIRIKNTGKARAELRGIQAQYGLFAGRAEPGFRGAENIKEMSRITENGNDDSSDLSEGPANLKTLETDRLIDDATHENQPLEEMIIGGNNGVSWLSKNSGYYKDEHWVINVELGPGETESYVFNAYIPPTDWDFAEVAIGVSRHSFKKENKQIQSDSNATSQRIWFANTLVSRN